MMDGADDRCFCVLSTLSHRCVPRPTHHFPCSSVEYALVLQYYRNLLPVANKLVGESRFRSDNDEKLQLLCAVDTQ